jgi:hypothetical protein
MHALRREHPHLSSLNVRDVNAALVPDADTCDPAKHIRTVTIAATDADCWRSDSPFSSRFPIARVSRDNTLDSIDHLNDDPIL